MKRSLLGTTLLTCFCWPAFTQPATSPTFEVASVKPGTEPVPIDMGGGRMMMRGTGGCSGGPGTPDPGLLKCTNASLVNLVTTAYGLKRYQIGTASFPSWMEQAKFDVTAKIPAGTSKEDLRLMEQNLLAERFKLVVHFEKKEMQVYELGIGKGGPKLKEAPPTSDQPVETGPPALPAMGKMERDKDGFMVMPRRSGTMNMMMSNGRMRLQATDQTMEQFTNMLINQLAKPITDVTGLKGKYDITLTCSADSFGSMAGPGMGMGMQVRMTSVSGGGGGGAPDAGAPPANDSEPAPTLFEAVQQQLGLKLEPKKGTVDLIVVDHSEKTPIEN